jgi:hypothetical protein
MEWGVEMPVVCCYNAVILLNNQKDHRHVVIEKGCSSNAIFIFNVEPSEEMGIVIYRSRITTFPKNILLHKSE